MAKIIEKSESSAADQSVPQQSQEASANSNPPTDGNQDKITYFPAGQGLARNQEDAVDYIADMLQVLCSMAKDVDLLFLNYLLEMAYEESLSIGDKTIVVAKRPVQ